MRVSISVSDFTWPGGAAAIRAELGAIVRAADQAGVDTIWLPDHLLQVDQRSSPDAEMLETYTTLGYIAGLTERVRLGAMVTPVTYRAPAYVIKSVTTLDVLTGGRAWLGLGAGYSEEEAKAVSLPFPPVAERFEHLEETLAIAFRMWSGDTTPFHGAHYRLENPISSPAPLTRPHPPVLIGGIGEKKTLPLVARHGDACNIGDYPDGGKTIERKLEVLRQCCADAGRPFEEIDKTVSTRFIDGESPGEFTERCHRFRSLGMDHPVLFTSWTRARAESLAPLVEAAAAV
ncbi:MAG TPA: TIGR03560 family F420-dependent LLM class oxidoreductase [Actinophytocola sp.]|jgi:F420-dependent oxidoreductase-like protein|uniref:TIGR03560 family F420-dependent LLM class oxidoreductase n=1 Tax=Actinophytocola sp. TaxID=1872138 RepID=UPI002F9415AC